MVAPKSTTWPLDPHTSAKHAILRRYLQAWIPILAQGGFPKVIYVDGFAGPGRYTGGEDGSPIIALKEAIGHATKMKGKIIFLFVEERPDRADLLKHLVAELKPPANFEVEIEGGKTFEVAFSQFRLKHADRSGRLPPIFAFIDPFGWTGGPFSLVKAILSQPSGEILLTFMYEEINRFIGHPDQPANFNALFGTSDWTSCVTLTNAGARNQCLHGLYLRQLKSVAKYVRSFQMRNASDNVDYYLFYATNNVLGLKKMKEAMWKVDWSGAFAFSDATDPRQNVLFGSEPNYVDLTRQILSRFKGRETSVGDVEEFVLTETPFRETHYKQRVLRPLELSDPPGLKVLDSPPGRRRGTYALDSLRLKFV